MALRSGTDMTAIIIDRTDFTVDTNGVPVKVMTVWWRSYLIQSGVTKYSGPMTTGIPPTYVPGQKAYATVTEADCTAWVTALETANGNAASPPYDFWATQDANLARQFSATVAPKSGSGRPWIQAYPVWVAPKAYAVNDIVNYQNVQGYKCIQAHTSQLDWQPPLVPALWKVYVPVSAGPQPWIQPTGASDDYQIPEQVTHNGHLWQCNTPNNVWEPGVFGWTDLGVYP